MLRKIREARPESKTALELSYADGRTAIVEFGSLMKRGGVFGPLNDPEFFAKVTVSEDGRSISWPGEIDFCADALWIEGMASEHSE